MWKVQMLSDSCVMVTARRVPSQILQVAIADVAYGLTTRFLR
jgi:hypothetical protein